MVGAFLLGNTKEVTCHSINDYLLVYIVSIGPGKYLIWDVIG